MKIKDTANQLRPYEKCIIYGEQALTDEELLAVIIKCGTKSEDCISLSRRILSYNKSEGLLNILSLSYNELININGIGKVKAIQIKCIGELSKRISKMTYSKKQCFSTAVDIANYYMEEMRHLKRERLVAMFLDTSCNYLGEYEVSLGTVNSSLASAREIFIEALKVEAVNIILVHNHPSGNPTPSNEDIKITSSLIEAGNLIGIHIIDHIIIGDNIYISFREKEIIY